MSSFRRKNLVGGLVELSRSQEPDHMEWKKIDYGKLVFQKDYGKKSYYFRLYTIDSDTKSNDFIWEHEMYTPFKYIKSSNLFHYFPSQRCYIGFNFSIDEQADKFFDIIDSISQARAELYENKIKTNNKSFFKSHLKEGRLFAGLIRGKQNKLEKNKVSVVEKTLTNLSTEKKVSQSERVALDERSPSNLINEIKKLEISASAPVPPPLPTALLQEPRRVEPVKKPVKAKQMIVDPQQALMESIRNFKGFQNKERQQPVASKQHPQDLNNQLKSAIVSRQKFFKQSSDESESDVEW